MDEFGEVIRLRANHGKPWTEEEKQILREQFGNVDVMTLVQKLKRSPKSITTKAYSLGITARENSELVSAIDVARLFGMNYSRTVIKWWIGKYGLKAKYINIERCSKRKLIMIDTRDLLEWMKNNQERYTTIHLELNILGSEPNWLKEKRKGDINKRKTRYWTKEEENRLIMYYRKGISYAEMADKFKRTPLACKKKIAKLFAT